MALKGDITTLSVRELLDWLARRRASGTLTLSQGMVVRQFHLKRGQVLLASSSEAEHLIGRLLVDRGLLSPAQVDAALSARGGAAVRFGKVITRSGLVSSQALTEVLTEKVRLMVDDCVGWTDGRFVFDDGPLPKKRAAVPLSMDLGLILAGAPPQLGEAEALAISDDDVLEARELAPS